MRALCLSAAVLLTTAGGCASKFSLVSPDELATELSSTAIDVPMEPVSLKIGVFDNRVDVRILNPGDEPVRIVGEESYVVTAGGETIAIPTGTIAPQSFIRYRLPPRPPYGGSGVGFGIGGGSYRSGVATGVGVGWRGDSDWDTGYDNPPYWSWPEGEVQLHVVLQQGETSRVVDLVFRRGGS